MFYRYIFALVAMCFGLAGCALSPVPENFEGFNTVQIVERVRCEAVTSLQDEIIQLLRFENDPLWQQLYDDRTQFVKFKVARLRDEREKFFYNRYIQSAIVLAFTFDIMEDNMDNSEIDLLKAITGGSVSLTLKASADRMRGNRRELVVSETFEHLLNDPYSCKPSPRQERFDPADRFDKDSHKIPNFVYPITGSIGLFEVVKTFVDLNEEGLLSPKQGAADKAPVLTNTLMFTTALTGSANPTVVLTQVGHAVDLKLASYTTMSSRKDVNTVMVALSLRPRPGFDQPESFGPLLAGASRGAATFARRTGDPAIQRALDAITQQRIDTFLDRFSQVVVP